MRRNTQVSCFREFGVPSRVDLHLSEEVRGAWPSGGGRMKKPACIKGISTASVRMTMIVLRPVRYEQVGLGFLVGLLSCECVDETTSSLGLRLECRQAVVSALCKEQVR